MGENLLKFFRKRATQTGSGVIQLMAQKPDFPAAKGYPFVSFSMENEKTLLPVLLMEGGRGMYAARPAEAGKRYKFKIGVKQK